MKTLHIDMLSALIEAHTEAELSENKIGGKEIIIHHNGSPVYHRIFGYASERERDPEYRMVYRAASMTKPITAVAVAQLADSGRLDLDGPASRYYPQMEHMQVAEVKNGAIVALHPAKNEIRVSDLLSHTSGVGSSPVFEILSNENKKLPLKAAVQKIARDPLAFEPRTNQSYSPTDAFDLAAGIVEMVSGMDYNDYLEKNIFAPLGMTDTTFAPTPAQWDRMAPMHDRTADGQSAIAQMPAGCVFEDYVPERMAAGAGIATTAADYIRFADMLCLGGVSPDGVRVLSENAVRRISTSNLPPAVNMGCEQWGLGIRVVVGADYPHGLGIGSFGWSGAYGTHFWVDPANRLSVVMMKNSRYDGGAGNRSACALERDVSESLF